MGTRVTYEVSDAIATITMDDGKVNVLSPAMLDELNAALDRAEADGATVVLTGRAQVFSAGFDLKVLQGFDSAAAAMLKTGFSLARRLLSHPQPVIVACNGHGVAMGAFLILSADHRIGIAGGDHHIRTNEVAIGMVMPRAALEITRQRLTPAAFEQAMVLAEPFSHEAALTTGFLDALAPADQLLAFARSKAASFNELDPAAHTGTKQRAREAMLARLDAAIEADDVELLDALAAGDRGGAVPA